jgi:KRAB domain-containing zinc finger protein
MKLHLKVSPHLTCDTCGKAFRTNSNLNSHMATHSEAKNYECNICGKAMKRKEALINHVKQHTGLKRFTCEFCTRTFFYITGKLIKSMPDVKHK